MKMKRSTSLLSRLRGEADLSLHDGIARTPALSYQSLGIGALQGSRL